MAVSPDGAGAQHEHRLPAGHPAAAKAVHRHRKGFHQGSLLPGQVIGDRIAACGAPLDELGEAALFCRRVLAQDVLPDAAVPAAVAGPSLADGVDGDAPADQRRVHAIADRDDLPGDFVARWYRLGARIGGVQQQV